MSTPHPHSAADLALAPVLISIERNLARLRDSEDLEFALALELAADSSWYPTAADRARRVRRGAPRAGARHGGRGSPAPGRQGLAVEHGGDRWPLRRGKPRAD